MDTYFEEYMGDLFYRIINHYNPDIETVIELGPGFRTKIAHALSKINFKGNLYIIDINKKVIEFVKKEYKRIIPDANIICIQKSLLESIKLLPDKIDLFLSNHPLDDMMMSLYLKDSSHLAFDNTDKSKEYLYSSWKNLIKNKEKIDMFRHSIISEFITLFKNIDIDLTVISQYKSAYYHNLGVDKEVKRNFLKLKSLMNTNDEKLNEIFDFPIEDFDFAKKKGYSLKENIQNSKNWIVGKYEV